MPIGRDERLLQIYRDTHMLPYADLLEESEEYHSIAGIPELWARFIEEFREIDAEVVRMLGGIGNPTFEQVRFHCTAPDDDGIP